MPDSSPNVPSCYDANKGSSQGWFESDDLMSVDSSSSRSVVDEPQVQKKDSRIKNRTELKNKVKTFGRRSRTSFEQPTNSPSDYASTPQHPSYMKATSCSKGKRSHLQASSHSSESSFDSSDQSSSPSYFQSDSSASSSRKSLSTLSRISSFRSVKILTNKASSKSKRFNSNYHQVTVKSTCSSTLKDLKFPKHVELHPGQSESDRISKVRVCSYHHCSLNNDPSPLVKRVYTRKRLLKSQKSNRLVGESAKGDKFSVNGNGKTQLSPSLGAATQGGNCVMQDRVVYGENEAIEFTDLAEIAFGETSFPERSYQETINIMRKYSTLEQDILLKCYNCTERDWDECTSVSDDDVDSNNQCVTASIVCDDEDIDADFYHMLYLPLLIKSGDNVTKSEENENINRELSKYEPFVIKTRLVRDDLVAAKCGTEFSSASASNTGMELKENLKEKDGKSNPTEDLDIASCPVGDSESRNYPLTEDAESNASAKKLNVPQFAKEKHRSMWSLIHRHMIPDVSTELDSKLTCGADDEDHKNEGNKSCAAESSDSFLNFLGRESLITNQVADNQEIEVRKLFAIKLVQEAIERILIPEVQDQSSDDQSVTNEVCSEENFKESDSKNEECDKASELDEGSMTREIIGSPDKQKMEGQVTNNAEKKARKHWSNLKRWILLQRFIKELENVRKFNPRKPRYLQLEPDPEAEKVNLKTQTADERKRAEEWMLDYALQQAISQLAPTQKRKVGLLVTAFQTMVPPQGGMFPKLKTRNEENLQITGKGNALVSIMDKTVFKAEALVVTEPKVGEKYSKRVDVRSAGDDWPMFKDHDTQKTILQPVTGKEELDELTGTSSDKVSVEGKAKTKVKEDEHSKLEPETRINVSRASHEKVECSGSNDSLTNDGDVAPETDINVSSASECEARESTTVSSNENEKITESEGDDGTYRRQVNKQKHISMWHMISQHVLLDVVSKVGSELLDGVDDEVEDNNTPAAMNTNNSLQDSSKTKDDADTNTEDPYTSHYARSFSRNDAVNLIREAVSQILTTTQDDSYDTQSVTSGEKNSSNSFCESLRHHEMTEGGIVLGQETKELADNAIGEEEESVIPHAKSKLEPQKFKNWSKLKKLILLKRSIKALESDRKFNPQPPQLLPPTLDQEQEEVDLRHQMTDERKKAEQWMLDNAVQHMVNKLTPARKRRVAMLVEAFEAVVPLPEL